MRFSLPWLLVLGCNGPDDGPGDRSGDDDDDDDTTSVVWECTIEGQGEGCEGPPYASQLGCQGDFDALASLPLDASIPGARSVKTVLDRIDPDGNGPLQANTLYFQNSVRYPIHWDFASNNLSVAQGFPPVPDLAGFNGTEYYSPDRRFILGAIVYYEAPDLWTYEIAPYDTADAEMVAQAFNAIRENTFFGKDLYFHPSSVSHEEQVVPNLPPDIPIVTTDELFEGVSYQPYNYGTTTGLLTFKTAEEVDGTYTPYRELVVLDAVPNDISIVAGIITEEFQTPLAHINVLSVNRGTPNMGLANATSHPDLVALEGKWVELTVGPFEWSIKEITAEEAQEYFEEHLQPEPLPAPVMDLSVSELRNVEDIVPDGAYEAGTLEQEIQTNITRFGSKGTNYAGVYDVNDVFPGTTPIQDAFVIPFYWYDQHVRTNGLRDELVAVMQTKEWLDPEYREEWLEGFKLRMVAAPLDANLLAQVYEKANDMWPGQDTRFRSSTNAEDLGNFTGAGLYNSVTGEIAIPSPLEDSVEWAIKTAWSNLWNPRAYEERDYYGIDQLSVGMALLTTPNFPEEEANGVALTNNVFDASGLEPAFFVNAQIEDYEVVQPEPGVISDSYIHYFYTAGQPIVYISHSNLIPPGQTVLTPDQSHQLGVALDAIHQFFFQVYGIGVDWYGLEVDFKFDDKYDPGNPQLFLKQARPIPWKPGTTNSVCPTDGT